MVRLCLTRAAGLAVIIGSIGCTGQNLEGRWFGNLPLQDAKDCSVEMYSNHRFNLFCRGAEWAGTGTYEARGDELTLEFGVLSRRGKLLSHPEPLAFTVDGHGNELDLRWKEQKLRWQRRL